MTESRFKKLVISATIGAVLLLVILLSVLVYQLVSIKAYKDKEAELNLAIAEYKQIIAQGEDTIEARSKRWWIERRARELGYIYLDDVLLG